MKEEKFVEDERYSQANREALATIVLFVLNFIWWYGFAYGLGSKPVEQYKYIMGLPAWFFYSCVVGFVVISVSAWLMVKLFFKEMPLDSDRVE